MNKVLMLFPRFGIGGIAKAMSFVANVCAEEGMDVCCISMSEEEKLINFSSKIRTRIIEYGTEGNLVKLFLNKVRFLLRFRKEIKKERPDIIISFGTDLIRITVFASIGLNTKIIGSERGNPGAYTNRQFKKYTFGLKKCDAVVFQTEAARNFYCTEIQKNSLIIPNPCIARSERKENKLINKEKVIVSCGRLSPEKNFQGLIRAFCNAGVRLEQYQLHIYGSGPEEKNLVSLIESLNAENIVLCGMVQDVFAVENNCSMFVLASYTDGMPNALIEAMLEGIPCIATDCPPGGVAFLADDGRRVALVPVDDTEKLTNEMIKLAEDSDYAALLIRNAKEIKDVLDPVKIGKEWLSLVKKVANS